MENRLSAQQLGGTNHLSTSPAIGFSLANSRASGPAIHGGQSVGVTRQAQEAAGPSNAKRARKDRGLNWQPREVLALIRVKRDLHLQELDTVDARDLMTPDTTKWARVSHEVMLAGLSPYLRDGPACKTKWNQLILEYKRLADYFSRTGRNIPKYWDLTAAQRKAEGLPRQFPAEFFHAIHEWYGSRPQIQPPHVRDLLSPSDGNYEAVHTEQGEDGEDESIEVGHDDPMQISQHDALQTSSDTVPPSSPQLSMSSASRREGPQSLSVGVASRPFNGLPPGITPHIISSSDNTASDVHKRPGNTAVRRKNLSGHTIIAEATKATGATMASQMQQIADASLQVERSKIDVQLKLFTEQMAYQRDKDLRLYEAAHIANENARLAIMKQGDMVNCLSQLSEVLAKSLTTSSNTVKAQDMSTPKQSPATSHGLHNLTACTGHNQPPSPVPDLEGHVHAVPAQNPTENLADRN